MESESSNYVTIDDMNTVFSNKISVVQECLELRFVDDDVVKSFQRIEENIDDLAETFKEIREEIIAGEQKVIEMQNLLRKIESINKRLFHMETNIPVVFNKAEVAAPQKEVMQEMAKPGPVTANKVVAKMKFVTVQEFEAVPKYMKGRIRYEQINKFVDDFNVAIDGKYKMLSMPRKGMSATNLKTWQKLKAQENADTKGLYFCTADDLKEYGSIKFDRLNNNMLTILRHCSKMKEIRGPGPIIRYTVVT